MSLMEKIIIGFVFILAFAQIFFASDFFKQLVYIFFGTLGVGMLIHFLADHIDRKKGQGRHRKK